MSFNMNLSGRGAAGASIGQPTGSIVPKGYKRGQLAQYTPQQQELFSRLFGQVGPESYLSRLAGGSEEAFGPMEERAGREFQESLGGLSSRFSGMGSGARQSSAFQNLGSQAASDFASRLQEQRHEYQREALRDLMEMSQSLLSQRPYEQFVIKKQPKEPSFLSKLGIGAVQGLTGGLRGLLAGGF